MNPQSPDVLTINKLNAYFQNVKWQFRNNAFELLGPRHDYLNLDKKLLYNSARFQNEASFTAISNYHQRKQGYNMCFEDCWTLYFWTKYLNINRTVSKINIIHLDDHLDLMSPLIYKFENDYFQITNDEQIDIKNTHTITKLIKNGCISIGSFIAPLIHYLDEVNIYHLKKDAPFQAKPKSINATFINEWPYVHKKRIAVTLNSEPNKYTKGNYVQGRCLKQLLSEMIDNPTFFHVDLDYFVNYYNGIEPTDRLKPFHQDHVKEIKQIATDLAQFKDLICDFTIATSPGFCPSDLWHPLVAAMTEHILFNSNRS